MIIKNFHDLALNNKRKLALEIIETGLKALDYEKVLRNINLNFENYKNIFLIGFGKGSAEISKILGKNIEFEEIEHPSFISGRVAKIVENGKEIGILGEIHPIVLENFKVYMPVAAFEISLE